MAKKAKDSTQQESTEPAVAPAASPEEVAGEATAPIEPGGEPAREESTEPAVADEPLPEPGAIFVAAPILLPHQSNGKAECRVPNHGDGYGPCQRCLHCKIKYRPQEMTQACPARA